MRTACVPFALCSNLIIHLKKCRKVVGFRVTLSSLCFGSTPFLVNKSKYILIALDHITVPDGKIVVHVVAFCHAALNFKYCHTN